MRLNFYIIIFSYIIKMGSNDEYILELKKFDMMLKNTLILENAFNLNKKFLIMYIKNGYMSNN